MLVAVLLITLMCSKKDNTKKVFLFRLLVLTKVVLLTLFSCIRPESVESFMILTTRTSCRVPKTKSLINNYPCLSIHNNNFESRQQKKTKKKQKCLLQINDIIAEKENHDDSSSSFEQLIANEDINSNSNSNSSRSISEKQNKRRKIIHYVSSSFLSLSSLFTIDGFNYSGSSNNNNNNNRNANANAVSSNVNFYQPSSSDESLLLQEEVSSSNDVTASTSSSVVNIDCLLDLPKLEDGYVRIYLCRHGQTENNRLHKIQGARIDPPINNYGVLNSKQLGKTFGRLKSQSISSSTSSSSSKDSDTADNDSSSTSRINNNACPTVIMHSKLKRSIQTAKIASNEMTKKQQQQQQQQQHVFSSSASSSSSSSLSQTLRLETLTSLDAIDYGPLTSSSSSSPLSLSPSSLPISPGTFVSSSSLFSTPNDDTATVATTATTTTTTITTINNDSKKDDDQQQQAVEKDNDEVLLCSLPSLGEVDFGKSVEGKKALLVRAEMARIYACWSIGLIDTRPSSSSLSSSSSAVAEKDNNNNNNDGESGREVLIRIVDALNELIKIAMNTNNRSVIAVSHSTYIRILISLLSNGKIPLIESFRRIKQTNCCINVIDLKYNNNNVNNNSRTIKWDDKFFGGSLISQAPKDFQLNNIPIGNVIRINENRHLIPPPPEPPEQSSSLSSQKLSSWV